MPAYNFQKRFIADVRSGTKRQTMRANRKDGGVPKIGDQCYLYYGMRTKHCELLRVEPCIDVKPAWINCGSRALCVGNGLLYGFKITAFAIMDGFDSADDMFEFFEKHHGGECAGHVIYW